jgi:2-polyprenyl-3-methyl-5-hydroxy-6-metoxy-1,4-benzoquinol methylase
MVNPKSRRSNVYDEAFWNKRFDSDDYLYGTEPNSFLVEQYANLRGPVLSLSEGEGRNAAFLASHGFEVVCVDISVVALEKAQKLARSRGVEITTVVADLETFEPEEGHYGSVISISAHLPSKVRKRLYPLVERSLRPAGVIILEAYSETQLTRDTGGPKDVDMLMTVDKLRREFPNCEPLILHEIEREVREGEGHTGRASVVQFVARKKS